MSIIETLQTSWELTKNSWHFFKQHKRLMAFPIVSGVAYILFFPLAVYLGLHWFSPHQHELNTSQMLPLIAFAVLILTVASFIATFFSAAAIYYILEHMQLRSTSVKAAMKFAASRWWRVLQWAVINLFVTQVVAALERNHSAARNFILNMCGVAWQLATFFVIPFMIIDNIGPVAALKKSGKMFKNRWRRVIGTNLILFVITLITVSSLSLAGFAYYYTREFSTLVILMCVISALALVIRVLVLPLLQTIIRCAIFQMLRDDAAPSGFRLSNLESALVAHRKNIERDQ
jgi:hypothetical protein